MKLSVVIPAKNEEEYIGKVLEALLRQTEPPSEVLVVDNNSTDATYEKAKSYQEAFQQKGIHLVLLSCLHGDQLEARALGFGTAKYELILSLDADSWIRKEWCAVARTLFERDPTLVGAGGPMLYGQWSVTLPNALLFLQYQCFPGGYFFYGSNAVFRRDAYKESGGLSGCRETVTRYHLSEPYDDLYLSDRLKHEGRVRPFFSLWAKGTLRVNGKRSSFWDIFERWTHQRKESPFIRQGAQTRQTPLL